MTPGIPGSKVGWTLSTTRWFSLLQKKPQFLRIGVSGPRVTGVDLARFDSGQHNRDDDDSDALDDVRSCVLLL